MANVQKRQTIPVVDPVMTEKLKNLRNKDREMVRGKFIFHECPKGTMSFPFRKYKEDAIETFKLDDGEIYTLPLGVAKHLNTNCWYPSYSYKTNSAGRPSVQLSEKIRRCSFQSLEFIDIVDDQPIKTGLISNTNSLKMQSALPSSTLPNSTASSSTLLS